MFEEALPDLLKNPNGSITKHATFHDMEFLGMNLEEDPATTQNHSYYFGGDDEYLDQMQDAIMEKQQMPVEVLMQRSESRSSSKSEERLEIPGALSLSNA